MGSEQSIPIDSDKKEDNKCKDLFRILNVYSDIPDYRDYKYTLNNFEKNLEIKKEIDLRNNYDCCKIFNINNGFITAACISSIIYNELKKNGEELIVPSINFIFYNSLLIEYNSNNYNLEFVKISIRNTLKGLNKYGICSEEILPSDNLESRPYDDCYTFGKYFNFKYSRLSNDLNIIKKILNNNKCILCNITLYTSFLKTKMKKEGILDYPDEYDSILGMISCVIVGYTESKIIMRCCFGEDWGDKGYFFIDYRYLSDLCNDLWIIEVFIDKKKKFGLNIDIHTTTFTTRQTKKSIDSDKKMNDNISIRSNMLRGSVF